MADITHGHPGGHSGLSSGARWGERKDQKNSGRVTSHRSFQTARAHSHATLSPQKAQAIHPATVFLGIMLCGLIAPAAILIWAISQASLNLFN